MNRRGYYKIGASESLDIEISRVTLDNSLCLHVPEKATGTGMDQETVHDSSHSKIYRLNDIGDLQSKLMLIGGQQGKEKELGQIEKDCFLQVF